MMGGRWLWEGGGGRKEGNSIFYFRRQERDDLGEELGNACVLRTYVGVDG